MHRRLPRLASVVLLFVLAVGVRLSDGPGGAYLHGVAGVSDEPAYLGEAFYLNAALEGRAGGEEFFSYTPPFHQLLLSLAPVISPFSIEPLDSPLVAPPPPLLASPDGDLYAAAYLPAGSDPALLPDLLASLSESSSLYTPGRLRWLEEAEKTLAGGEPLLVSIFSPRSSVTIDPPLLRASSVRALSTERGVVLVDGESGDAIARLASAPVRSLAISIGADQPLSILIASIDERSRLRVWRLSDQSISPWGTGAVLAHEEGFDEARSVAAGPSGDLLLVSARDRNAWSLFTYESTSSISRIGGRSTEGPLDLVHHPGARETIARDETGNLFRLAGGPIAGARLLIALIGGLGAIFAFWFGLRVGGRRLAVGAALLFALDPLGVAAGRVAYQEQTLATLAFGALASLASALSPLTRSAWRWFLLAGLFGGLAAATKGFGFPIALTALIAGAAMLPDRLRRAFALLGALFSVGLVLAGLTIPFTGWVLAGGGGVLLAATLWRWSDGVKGWSPLLLSALAIVVGYLVPWLLRGVIYSAASGYPLLFGIIDTHLATLGNAARAADIYVSTWWLWPTGLSSISIEAYESGSIAWIQGATLALGLVALIGVRSASGRLIAIALLLAWGSWSIPVRYQMPYYAFVPTLIAMASLLLAARERPRGGGFAIPFALGLPLIGGLAFPEQAPLLGAPIAIALLAWAIVRRIIRDRSIPVLVVLFAWALAWPLALRATFEASPILALLLGPTLAFAAAGGWRRAPLGAALSSALLLLPETVAWSSLPLPSGATPSDWLSWSGHQVHPIGLAALGALLLAAYIRRSRSVRQ